MEAHTHIDNLQSENSQNSSEFDPLECQLKKPKNSSEFYLLECQVKKPKILLDFISWSTNSRNPKFFLNFISWSANSKNPLCNFSIGCLAHCSAYRIYLRFEASQQALRGSNNASIFICCIHVFYTSCNHFVCASNDNLFMYV
jgi:hypothetical protein